MRRCHSREMEQDVIAEDTANIRFTDCNKSCLKRQIMCHKKYKLHCLELIDNAYGIIALFACYCLIISVIDPKLVY